MSKFTRKRFYQKIKKAIVEFICGNESEQTESSPHESKSGKPCPECGSVMRLGSHASTCQYGWRIEYRGACGVRGCPNMRPHSHVMDLARRLQETKKGLIIK